MKYFLLCLCVVGIVFTFIFADKKEDNFELHITANSISEKDESTLYLVRDSLSEYLNNVENIQDYILEKYDEIKNIINEVLVKSQSKYSSVLKVGEKLEVILGEGEGKTCEVKIENNLSNSVYISKIWEILGL